MGYDDYECLICYNISGCNVCCEEENDTCICFECLYDVILNGTLCGRSYYYTSSKFEYLQECDVCNCVKKLTYINITVCKTCKDLYNIGKLETSNKKNISIDRTCTRYYCLNCFEKKNVIIFNENVNDSLDVEIHDCENCMKKNKFCVEVQ